MLNLIFPDGAIVTGRTFAQLEMRLRASQWRSYPSTRAFRQAMRKRAALWNGRRPKPVLYQSHKGFILSLVDSGMCMLEDTAANTATTQEQS